MAWITWLQSQFLPPSPNYNSMNFKDKINPFNQFNNSTKCREFGVHLFQCPETSQCDAWWELKVDGILTIGSLWMLWPVSCFSGLAVYHPAWCHSSPHRHYTEGDVRKRVKKRGTQTEESINSLFPPSFLDIKVTRQDFQNSYQFRLLFLWHLVLVAAIDGDVINPRQDPGDSQLAVFLLVHFLPEHVALRPQTALLTAA